MIEVLRNTIEVPAGKGVYVYRVQDQTGRGPFIKDFTQRWHQERTPQEYADLPPFVKEWPDFEMPEYPPPFVGCACTSLDQLRLWFNPREYYKLLKYHYECYRLGPVRILHESRVQCIYGSPLKSIPGKKVQLYPHSQNPNSRIIIP